MTYKKVSINITKKQLENAAKGRQITLSSAQVKANDSSMYVHPSSYEKIKKAERAGKGVRINICRGEIDHDLMNGGSLWSWIKNKLYPAVKPALSSVLDAAVAPISAAVGPQFAPAVNIGRSAIRSLTGVGIKGSQEAKARMAAVRAKRGGSFMLN